MKHEARQIRMNLVKQYFNMQLDRVMSLKEYMHAMKEMGVLS